MAELLVVKGWPEPGSPALVLRDGLGDEFTVIADPALHGQPFDAVVVGPQGIFVVRAKPWEGEITPVRRGPWLGRLPSGRSVRYPDPVREARQAVEAVQAFLRDEVPGRSPPVHYLLALTHAEATIADASATELLVVHLENLPAMIAATVPPLEGGLDQGARDTLAATVRDRQLSATQRASVPFVFRSGSLLGGSAKAWTIRSAVRYIDRHPEDGLYHLHNGTLARWLSEQGAEHLACLAREVLRGRETNPRAIVEAFLVGTGLVERPRLVIRPRSLHLGPVVAGEVCEARLSLRKGRGRGYLSGSVRSDEPWLRVEPTSFSGRLDALVTADTSGLPISDTPWQAHLLVESSATAEPVPVGVRVVAMPSPLNRHLVRPLAGALGAGAIGGGLGAALGAAGLALPGWLAGRLPPALTPALFWAALVGLVWALLGAVRGLRQPTSWSVGHAIGRWLLRLAAWGTAFVLLAAAGHLSWTHLGPEPAAGAVHPPIVVVVLLGLALAIVPATLAALWPARAVRGAEAAALGRAVRRRRTRLAAAALLALALVVGLPPLLRALQKEDLPATMAPVRTWVGGRWDRLEQKAAEAWERYILRTRDRRAPEQPPASATPAPTRTEDPAGTAIPAALPTGSATPAGTTPVPVVTSPPAPTGAVP
ncbi:MAG TPA: NERD domain-containing protein [Anaerolineae bacterium]|nr:NERD domain-containing protein [Anaerolineae bacterium]